MPRFAVRATLALPLAAQQLLRAAASLPRALWGPLELLLQLRGHIKLLLPLAHACAGGFNSYFAVSFGK